MIINDITRRLLRFFFYIFIRSTYFSRRELARTSVFYQRNMHMTERDKMETEKIPATSHRVPE